MKGPLAHDAALAQNGIAKTVVLINDTVGVHRLTLGQAVDHLRSASLFCPVVGMAMMKWHWLSFDPNSEGLVGLVYSFWVSLGEYEIVFVASSGCPLFCLSHVCGNLIDTKFEESFCLWPACS